MGDRAPIIPVPGNAFAQQAYRESLKKIEAERSGAGQNKFKDKPPPPPARARKAKRHSNGSSGSEKKPGDVIANIPNVVSETEEMHGNRLVQPAMPLKHGYVSKMKDKLGKHRAVTDPIARKPLNNSSSAPRVASDGVGPTEGTTNSADDHPKDKGEGEIQVQDANDGKKDSVPEAATPPAKTAESKESPAVASSSTTALGQPEFSSRKQAPGSGSSSPDIFVGGKPALSKHAAAFRRLSFFPPDDSEEEQGPESKKDPPTAEQPTQEKHDLPEAIVLGDGRMSPTRSGTFARLGNVNIRSAPRVTSISGQVENMVPVGMAEASPSIYAPVTPVQKNNPLPFDVRAPSAHTKAHDYLEIATRSSHDTNADCIPIGYRGQEQETTPQYQHVSFTNFVPPPPGNEYKPPSWHEEMMYQLRDMRYHQTREMENLARTMAANHNILMDHVLRKTDAFERRQTEMILQLAQQITTTTVELKECIRKQSDEMKDLIRGQTNQINNTISNSITNHGANMSAKLDALNSRHDHAEAKLTHIMGNQYALATPPEHYGAETGTATLHGARGNAFALAAASAGPTLVPPATRRISGHGAPALVGDPRFIAEHQHAQHPAYPPAMAAPYGAYPPHLLPPPGGQWYQQATYPPRGP